jgi:hypothetical protein
MQARLVTKIERNVDRAASALFAGAIGYAAYRWFAGSVAQPVLGAETGGIAAFAYLLAVRTLKSVRPQPRKLPVPIFDVRQVDGFDQSELLLTERYEAPAAADPLVLDDILAQLGPDSRVVRLFDPAAMPTPGQLNSRIEQHFERDAPAVAPQDASQALHDALAELRRSIR